MGNYYFVAASLPPLTIGQKPDLAFDDLEVRLKINLSKEDWKKVETLRRYTDLENIRSILMKRAIDPRGNLSGKELEEALLAHADLPEYLFDFLDQHETMESRLKNFPQLLSSYFMEEREGFLGDYLKWERSLRLLMVALRCKELNRDVSYELQFEDLKDPLVAYILAQKDAPTFELPSEFTDLKEIFLEKDPLERKRAVDQYRFDQIEQLVNTPIFSIDAILAYLVQLMIVEYWIELDHEEGAKILQKHIQG